MAKSTNAGTKSVVGKGYGFNAVSYRPVISYAKDGLANYLSDSLTSINRGCELRRGFQTSTDISYSNQHYLTEALGSYNRVNETEEFINKYRKFRKKCPFCGGTEESKLMYTIPGYRLN